MRIHKTFDREELKLLQSDQLDKMLHEELDKEQKDDALILMLLNILEEREMGEPSPEPGEAWQVFVERYNTQITPEPVMRRKSLFRWIGTVAAVIAVFFIAYFGVPKVVGYNNIVELIASWTDDFFYLSSPDDLPVQNEYVFETDNPGLQQVYDAVVEMGITDPVVPMWIPEGYELVSIKNLTISSGRKVCAQFENTEDSIVVYYKILDVSSQNNFPKDYISVETIEISGMRISILSNNQNISAIWNRDGIEVLLTTTENKKIATKIIESVFIGGKK